MFEAKDMTDSHIFCSDCQASSTGHARTNVSAQDLFIVAADYGEGAFLAVLCRVCDHRRWYRAQLRKRLRVRQEAVNCGELLEKPEPGP